MPQDLTVKTLKSVNPKIDLGEIDLLMALYAGGKRFEKFKPEFLIHREAETLGLANIESRLKRAQYVNRAAGLVDWIVSSATAGNPRIEGVDEYWQQLNENADGMGTPFSSVVRQLLADMLVARWPYVEARSIDDEPYTIWRRDPETVYDFQNDDNGQLTWIKTVCEQQARSTNYAAPDRNRIITTYYDDKSTVSYVVFKNSSGQYTSEDGTVLTDDTLISPEPSLSVYSHDFGAVPIFRGNATKTHWLMDRISEALKAIYNTEVDLSFSLSQCAYAQLVFELDSATRANNIVRSESGAWVLQTGEKAMYLAPPNTAFDGLFKNLERLNKSLGESLQMMAAETAAIPQAGRLSGEAVKEHRKPLDSLVQAIVWPVEDMLNRCLKQIAEIGNYDVPKIVGLGDGPDINMEELENGRSEDGRGTEEAREEAGTQEAFNGSD